MFFDKKLNSSIISIQQDSWVMNFLYSYNISPLYLKGNCMFSLFIFFIYKGFKKDFDSFFELAGVRNMNEFLSILVYKKTRDFLYLSLNRKDWLNMEKVNSKTQILLFEIMQKQNILRYASLKSTNPPPPYKNQPFFQNAIIYTKTKDDFTKLQDTVPIKNIRLLTEGSEPYNKNQPFLCINTNKDRPKRQTLERKIRQQENKSFDPSGQRLQKGISEKNFKLVGNFINFKKHEYIRKEKPTDCFWFKKDLPSKVYNNFVETRVNTEQNTKLVKQPSGLNIATQYWNIKQQKNYDTKPSTGYMKRTVKTQNDEGYCDMAKMDESSAGQFNRKSFQNAIRKAQADEEPSKNYEHKLGITFNLEKSGKNNLNSEEMSFQKVFMMKENKQPQQNKENRKTTCMREKTSIGAQRQRFTTNLNAQGPSKSPQIKPFSNNSNIIQERPKVTDLKKVSLTNNKYLAYNEPKKARLCTEDNEKEQKSYLYKQKATKTMECESLQTSQLVKKPVDWKRQLVMMDKIGQGTFGKVYKAKLRQQSEKTIYAVKRVYIDKKYKSRELQIVQELNHPQVMKVHSVFVATKDVSEQYLNIVMDYYDKNLFEVINENAMKGGVRQPLAVNKGTELQQKIFIYQILKGLSYIHSLKICHRDIKPHNMLVKGWELVLCDFGSAKKLIPGEDNLSYICSRCYRAPELIFGSTGYTAQIDMWSVACVIIEMLHGLPLFIGENSLDHLLEVIKVVGTPSKQEVLQMNPNYDISEYDLPIIKRKSFSRLFPKADPKLIDLVNKLMIYNPNERLSAIEALAHNYFDELRREDTFKILEGHLNQEKLEKMYEFSEKEIEMYNATSEARKKTSKAYPKYAEPTLSKKTSDMTQILTLYGGEGKDKYEAFYQVCLFIFRFVYLCFYIY